MAEITPVAQDFRAPLETNQIFMTTVQFDPPVFFNAVEMLPVSDTTSGDTGPRWED